MKFYFLLFFLSGSQLLFAQDKEYVKKVVRDLASEEMAGRGYVESGDKKAAKYIAKEFSKAGLEKFDNGWFQKFEFQVNTFPDDVEVSIDGRELFPGKDFIVAAGSPSIEGEFSLLTIDITILQDSAAVAKLESFDFPSTFVVLNDSGMSENEKKDFRQLEANPFNAKGIIVLREKLTWSVSQKQSEYPVVEILHESWQGGKSIELEIDAKLKNHKASNVMAYVPGTEYADSFIVFTAHYDHLGMMGEDAVFYGANDNASGIAAILDMARHYKQNPSKYSVMFIGFAAEEAGLLGSYHYVENPLFPLEKIKVLLNMDLLGNGSEGIMVVNGAIHEEDFDLMTTINDEEGLLPEIKKRGEAANSDHYFFSEKGVKAFFIYTLGGGKAYHDIFDVPESIQYEGYNGVFQLLTRYVKKAHE